MRQSWATSCSIAVGALGHWVQWASGSTWYFWYSDLHLAITILTWILPNSVAVWDSACILYMCISFCVPMCVYPLKHIWLLLKVMALEESVFATCYSQKQLFLSQSPSEFSLVLPMTHWYIALRLLLPFAQFPLYESGFTSFHGWLVQAQSWIKRREKDLKRNLSLVSFLG